VALRDRLAPLAAAAALLAAPAPGAAQAVHPDPPERHPRALHLRLAECDALALARVEAALPGRIQLTLLAALRGQLPPRFELKRAPSAPPPLAPGERALLLLRGARSPYLLVDRPDELWKLEGGESERALAEAVAALDAAGSRPAEQAAVYAGWLGSGDAPLARAAAQGVAGDAALLAVAPPDLAVRLADAALDAPDAALREAASRAAAHDPAVLRRVLAGLPGAAADAEVVTRALAAGLRQQPEAARAAALRALAHPSSSVRLAALRLGSLLAADPALRAELTRLASEDADEEVRLAARRGLERR
jgi:hypothetical protein